MSDTRVLQIRDVRHAFGGLEVLDGVQFDVRRGLSTALIGPNGSGKTTLFNIISGLIHPDEGSILVGGTEVVGRPAVDRVGLGLVRTFQAPHLFGGMSVIENVVLGHYTSIAESFFLAPFPRPIQKRKQAQVRAHAEELLQRYGLGESIHIDVKELPSGQQRLIEAVRALASEPTLLLLDEPTSGLNNDEIGVLKGMITDLAAAGGTPFIISHDMAFVGDLADEIHVLSFGNLIASGTPEQVRTNPAVMEAYLGSAAANLGS